MMLMLQQLNKQKQQQQKGDGVGGGGSKGFVFKSSIAIWECGFLQICDPEN